MEENNKILINNKKKNMDDFINRNSEKIKEKVCCSICAGSYTYFNKSMHNKTKRHLKMLEMNKTNNVRLNI
jgi:hypothetical protein